MARHENQALLALHLVRRGESITVRTHRHTHTHIQKRDTQSVVDSGQKLRKQTSIAAHWYYLPLLMGGTTTGGEHSQLAVWE